MSYDLIIAEVRRNNWLLARRQEGGKLIHVEYFSTETPLGTEDGQSYTVTPQQPTNEEEGQHGRR